MIAVVSQRVLDLARLRELIQKASQRRAVQETLTSFDQDYRAKAPCHSQRRHSSQGGAHYPHDKAACLEKMLFFNK